jgi:hypothetical protein
MEAERKLTPTERLHDLAMAAITKPASPRRGAETISVKQAATGNIAGRWYCDGLAVVVDDDETLMEAWSRALDVASQVQRDLIALNAASIQDELNATLHKAKS